MDNNDSKKFSFYGNSYIVKIDNMTVEMKYSDNNRSLRECIENILARKLN